jgi:hypothetical protein
MVEEREQRALLSGYGCNPSYLFIYGRPPTRWIHYPAYKFGKRYIQVLACQYVLAQLTLASLAHVRERP